jgi:hypothetical protein
MAGKPVNLIMLVCVFVVAYWLGYVKGEFAGIQAAA